MITVKLNNEDITANVSTGMSFIDKLDIELDQGQISILHVPRKEQYDIFDIIKVEDDGVLIFDGRISSDKVTLSSFSDELYNHELNLIEHTKILERFIVPGKTFTQPTEQATYPEYDLLSVVEILRDTVPLEIEGVHTNPEYRVFQIPQETRDLLEGVIAPEFNFHGLTLREALDRVASVLDGIVRLNGKSQLIIDRFNDLKKLINGQYINYSLNQNANAYASNMQLDIANPVNAVGSGIEVYPGEGLFTTLRSRDFVFNSDTSYIPTFNKIYDVDRVVFHVRVEIELNGVAPPATFYDIPVNKRIVEKRYYETLDRLGSVPRNTDDFTQNTTIFFTYGRKNIETGETTGLFNTNQAIDNTIFLSTLEHLRNIGEIPQEMKEGQYTDFETGDEWQVRVIETFSNSELLSRVYYTPMPTSLYYQVEKDRIEDVKYHTTLTGNQGSRIVDINDFVDSLKSKINRSGNSEIQLSQRVKNLDTIYNLGDYTEDNYIITNREIVVDREFYTVNYLLSRDFNKISQFISLNQEIRQYEIGESGRTIERDLIYNEYIELEPAFSTDTVNPENTSLFAKDLAIEKFWDTIDSTKSTYSPINYGLISNETITHDILVPLNKVNGGNSISFSFNLETNASAANKLFRDTEPAINRDLNLPVRYTDVNGRFNDLDVSFYSEELIMPTDDNIGTEVDLKNEVGDFLPELTVDKPSTREFNSSFYVNKDNREIINMNIMYHVLSKEKNKLIVGEAITSNNAWINNVANGVKLRLYEQSAFGEFTDRLFTEKDRSSVSAYTDFVEISSPSLTIDTTNNKIIINEDLTGYDAWALIDSDDVPYFLMNGLEDTIVYSFKNKRSDIVYDLFNVIKTEEISLIASSVSQGVTLVLTGQVELIDLIAQSIGQGLLDQTTEQFENVDLIANSISNAILDFDTFQLPGVALLGQSVVDLTLDFQANPIVGQEFIGQSVSLGTLSITAEPIPGFGETAKAISLATIDFIKEEDIELTAQATSSATLDFTTSEFEKVWVFKTLSGPFDVTLDLGEVTGCPGTTTARDELESAFPAANQSIGDKGNVTSFRVVNGFPSPCDNMTYEVEAQ